MKVPIFIETDDKHTEVCGQDCPFICGDACILFDDELIFARHDGRKLLMLRCDPCINNFNTPEEYK